MPIKKTSNNDKEISFMLEEYATLRELKINLDNKGDNRVNFFLATISGASVALGLLNQLTLPVELLFFLNASVFVGILFLGNITFARMVERHSRNIEYERGMNRVRRYFVDKYPSIEKYMFLPLYDDKPRFGYTLFDFKEKRWGITGLAPLVGIINSIVATVGVVVFARMVLLFPVLWSYGVGLLVFLIMAYSQYRYLVNRMKRKQISSDVHFPNPTNIKDLNSYGRR